MAGPVRVVLKRKGMRQLLISKGVEGAIGARTKRVEDAVRIAFAGFDPPGYERPPVVDSTVGPNKGRRRIVGRVIVVHPLAMLHETETRALARALLAARR